jgi:hypothetical protein
MLERECQKHAEDDSTAQRDRQYPCLLRKRRPVWNRRARNHSRIRQLRSHVLLGARLRERGHELLQQQATGFGVPLQAFQADRCLVGLRYL